jgi:hypothetical protein
MNAKANLHEQFGRFDHYWNLSSWPASTTGEATEMLMAEWSTSTNPRLQDTLRGTRGGVALTP